MIGLILLALGVMGLRKRPTQGILLALIGEVLIITAFMASRHSA